ncbi:MAG: DUF3298 domain-containing protein [Bacillota bacterium]|nr:DUF3298 domain-containing protein [Bacillota bacterium]
MKRKVVVIFALISLALCACVNKKPAKGTSESAPSQGSTQNSGAQTSDSGPRKIDSTTESRIISSDEGEKLISIDLSLPKLGDNNVAGTNVNSYYDNVLQKYLDYAEYDLKPAALEQIKISAEQGSVFNEYSLNSDYAVTLNTPEYLSVSREFDYYTGGAHPGMDLKAETFDMSNGGLMNLSDIFSVSSDVYLPIIYDEVITQIESPNAKPGKADLFENYKELVKSSFDPADFYLTPDGITVFYQLYSIAPYAAGAQYYTIPYDKFEGKLKINADGMK